MKILMEKAGMTLRRSDKIDFRRRKITRNKEERDRMTKRSADEET